jgi:hypothetical protein
MISGEPLKPMTSVKLGSLVEVEGFQRAVRGSDSDILVNSASVKVLPAAMTGKKHRGSAKHTFSAGIASTQQLSPHPNFYARQESEGR